MAVTLGRASIVTTLLENVVGDQALGKTARFVLGLLFMALILGPAIRWICGG